MTIPLLSLLLPLVPQAGCDGDPVMTCGSTVYACESSEIYQGTHQDNHRGWDLAAPLWDDTDSIRDVLAGSFRRWDSKLVPSNKATSAMLYLSSNADCCVEQADVGYKGEFDGDRFGWAVGSLGDLDEDGFDDFAIAAPRGPFQGRSFSERGRVYFFLSGSFVHPGPPSQSLAGLPNAALYANVILEGENVGDRLGHSIAAAGDFDGDPGTVPHIVLGAPGGLLDTTARGHAYVIPGSEIVTLAGLASPPSMPAVPIDVSNLAGVVKLTGRKMGDRLGFDVALAGDVNGDGFEDVVVGAPQFMIIAGSESFTSTGKGYAMVVGGPTPGVPLAVLRGTAPGDRFGYSVSGAVNTDGDSSPATDEVVVGAPNFDGSAGADTGLGVVYSVSSGVVKRGEVEGTQVNELAGWNVLGIGQFTGVGYDDWAVGSRNFGSLACGSEFPCSSCVLDCFGELGENENQVGRVQVFEGRTGALCLTAMGEHGRDSLGMAMARIGDAGGSSKEDLLVAALRWNHELKIPQVSPGVNLIEPGRVYVFLH